MHQWEEFLHVCSTSDDWQEYVIKRPGNFNIPFHTELFMGARKDFSSVPPAASVPRKVVGRVRLLALIGAIEASLKVRFNILCRSQRSPPSELDFFHLLPCFGFYS